MTVNFARTSRARDNETVSTLSRVAVGVIVKVQVAVAGMLVIPRIVVVVRLLVEEEGVMVDSSKRASRILGGKEIRGGNIEGGRLI